MKAEWFDIDMQLIHLSDPEVSDLLHSQLCALLCICFPENSDIFGRQRFFHQVPAFRWCVFDHKNQLVAHTALHLKEIMLNSDSLSIGGIAEVCVHPSYRKKGWVKKMLSAVEEWLKHKHIDFALLLGEEKIYTSSGYVRARNRLKFINSDTGLLVETNDHSLMIKSLTGRAWNHQSLVDLNGPVF